VRVVCKEDGGVGTDVGGVVFPLWSLCLSLSLSLSLSLALALSLFLLLPQDEWKNARRGKVD